MSVEFATDLYWSHLNGETHFQYAWDYDKSGLIDVFVKNSFVEMLSEEEIEEKFGKVTIV